MSNMIALCFTTLCTYIQQVGIKGVSEHHSKKIILTNQWTQNYLLYTNPIISLSIWIESRSWVAGVFSRSGTNQEREYQ